MSQIEIDWLASAARLWRRNSLALNSAAPMAACKVIREWQAILRRPTLRARG